MRQRKVILPFLILCLIVAITGLLVFQMIFVPGVDREIAQVESAGIINPVFLDDQRDDMVRNGFLCFFLMGVTFLLIPLSFIFFWYIPLRETVILSFVCLGGNTHYPLKETHFQEFEDLRANLLALARESRKISDSQQALLSNLTHDIRSPLTSIRGYSQAILDGTIPPEAQAHYLEIIITLSDRLTEMSEDMLILDRLHNHQIRLTFSSFDINALIVEITQSMEILWTHKNLQLQLSLESPLPPVRADRTHIAQVIYNLMDNAIQFSRPGQKIILSSYPMRDRVYVSVRDFGIGIPSDQLSMIWERFYQADLSRTDHPDQGMRRGGSGLGLAIVREIIDLHGQVVSVHSNPGSGTEFIFSLATEADES